MSDASEQQQQQGFQTPFGNMPAIPMQPMPKDPPSDHTSLTVTHSNPVPPSIHVGAGGGGDSGRWSSSSSSTSTSSSTSIVPVIPAFHNLGAGRATAQVMPQPPQHPSIVELMRSMPKSLAFLFPFLWINWMRKSR